MPSRRNILLGGLLCASGGYASCTCSVFAEQVPQSKGCLLTESDADRLYPAGAGIRTFVTGEESVISDSGDREFDRALARTLAKCADMFSVLPGFAFYDDSRGMNAYATTRVRMDRTDGTVLMGKRMLRRLMNMPEAPDACVAAVCAHEFGHILQFKRRLLPIVGAGQPTGKRVELQADFFAGYFAGVRKRERSSFPAAVFAMTQYTFGDNMIDNPNHHGTQQERGQAVVQGYLAAFEQKLNLSDAIERSIRYVKAM